MNAQTPGPKRALLRHVLAVLAYRTTKAIENPPEGFANFNAGAGVRTPVQLLAHMASAMTWAFNRASGERVSAVESEDWEIEVARFYRELKVLDDYLATQPLVEGTTEEKLVQGPISDALTHAGQLAMLGRLGGASIAGENFLRADIRTGRVGPEQTPPVAPMRETKG